MSGTACATALTENSRAHKMMLLLRSDQISQREAKFLKLGSRMLLHPHWLRTYLHLIVPWWSQRLQVGGKVEEAAEKVERKGQDVKKAAQ